MTPLRSLRLVHTKHRHAILVTLAMILLLQWSAIAYWITQEGQATQARAETVLRQMTVSVQEQTQRLFLEIDTALTIANFWLMSHPHADPRTDPEFAHLVDIIRNGSDGMIELRLLSTDGRLFAVPERANLNGLEVSDRKYYQIQKDAATRGMYIGDPMRTRVSDDNVVPVSYPLHQPIGGIFALFAAIRLDRLIPVYDDIRFKPNGTIVLLRSDGVVLARAPDVEKYIGRSIAESYDYLHFLSAADSGMYMSGASALDGLERLVSFTKMDNYPLTIAVTAGGEDAFRVWRNNRRLVFVGGALLSLLLIGGALGTFFVLGLVQQSEEQLRRMALFDALTGWLNRHAFDDAAQREFAMAVRRDRPLAVLSLDLDHFKHINDSYGHAAGDVVLRQITKAWSDTLRATDVMGRVGGEEFVVIMPDTDAEQAFAVARHLLDRTREAVIEVDGKVIHVTVSIGAAAAAPFDYAIEDVLLRSDAALYDAKHLGRDRAVMAEPKA